MSFVEALSERFGGDRIRRLGLYRQTGNACFIERRYVVYCRGDSAYAMHIYSSAGVLETGQTTDIMESRKFEVHVAILLSVDVVSEFAIGVT